jgi:hypothetical protein
LRAVETRHCRKIAARAWECPSARRCVGVGVGLGETGWGWIAVSIVALAVRVYRVHWIVVWFVV